MAELKRVGDLEIPGDPDRGVARAACGGAGARRLTVEAEYLAGFSVESVTPEPESVDSAGGRLVYTFEPAPSEVSFSLTPDEVDRQQGAFALEGQPPVSRAQLVYP